MRKEERKKQRILFTLGLLPLVSTDLIARLFPELKYPNKQASKLLKELEHEKLVEGYARRMGETKVWRLTRKGRQFLDVKKNRIPFNTRKLSHYLKIAEAYFDLWDTGNLTDFTMEWREDFINNEGNKRVYAPDAFFIYDKKPYFLEVQQSYLTRLKWAEKWKIAHEFYFEGNLASSNLPSLAKQGEMPQILVITDQKEPLVTGSARLDVRVFSSMKEFITSC